MLKYIMSKTEARKISWNIYQGKKKWVEINCAWREQTLDITDINHNLKHIQRIWWSIAQTLKVERWSLTKSKNMNFKTKSPTKMKLKLLYWLKWKSIWRALQLIDCGRNLMKFILVLKKDVRIWRKVINYSDMQKEEEKWTNQLVLQYHPTTKHWRWVFPKEKTVTKSRKVIWRYNGQEFPKYVDSFIS